MSDEGIYWVPRRGGGGTAQILGALNFVRMRIVREGVSCFIRWEVPHTFSIPVTAKWLVERSGSPAGPFRSICDPLDYDARSLRDDDIPTGRSFDRRLYYRIRVYDEASGLDQVSGFRPPWLDALGNTVFGQTWGPQGQPMHEAPAVLKEVRARAYAMLCHYNAELVFCYRSQWDQPANPNTVGKAGTDYGIDLFDTSTTSSGYYRPFPVYVTEGQSNPEGRGIRGITLWWPGVEKNDVLRAASDSQAWTVEYVQPIESYGHVAHYEISLKEEANTHPIHKVPMPSEYAQLSPFPRRQYGRVTNLEAYRESLVSGSMSTSSRDKPTSRPDADYDS